MDPTESLLNAWRANPEVDRAGALCRVLGARAGDSPEHRRVLSDVAPQIMSRHARDVGVQLELARACIAARDMFLSDSVLKPLLQLAPNEPQVWRLLGEVFLRAGNAKDAETAFEGAIARGLRDSETMRWHEKARGCRNLQGSGGHPAVAAEVLRWTESWGSSKSTHERLVESPDSQRTVIREPPPSDLDQTIIRGPMAADLALADKVPDSERTAFYQKPDKPIGLDDTAKDPGPGNAPTTPFPQKVALGMAAPLPKAPPIKRPPQHVGAIELSGDRSLLDEESMDIDVLKLPDGDRLDEVLDALRKSEGLVIEEPTGFYMAPQFSPEIEAKIKAAEGKPDILALAQQGKLPNVSALGGTMMMPTAPSGAGASSPNYPLPPPPPPAPTTMSSASSPDAPTGPSRRILGGAASVESPSGVIINAASGSDTDAMAPTARPDAFMFSSEGPAGMLVAGPPGPGLTAPLPLGPGPKATTVRPPKGKSRKGLYFVLFLLIALSGGAYYAVRVRGLVKINGWSITRTFAATTTFEV